MCVHVCIYLCVFMCVYICLCSCVCVRWCCLHNPLFTQVVLILLDGSFLFGGLDGPRPESPDQFDCFLSGDLSGPHQVTGQHGSGPTVSVFTVHPDRLKIKNSFTLFIWGGSSTEWSSTVTGVPNPTRLNSRAVAFWVRSPDSSPVGI